LVRRPLYPAIALAILSLGLAASIAAFTYVRSFSQSFPGSDPSGLVQLFGTEEDEPFVDVSFLDYLDYAESSRSFESLAAVQPYYAAIVRHEEMTEVAFLEAVTGDYFRVLRAEPFIGRLLTPDDDRLESDQAAVISYEWWQSRYRGDRSVLGQTLFLNYRPFTIVGVMSPEFVGSASDNRPHTWIPIAHFRDRYVGWDRAALNRDVPLVRVYGRLGNGVGVAQATKDVENIARNLDDAYPRLENPRAVRLQDATWIHPSTKMDEASTNRIMVMAAAGFLLLVCANVANLLLSVFSVRKREFALRAALGASPARIFRGIVAQNLLLSGTAGLIALGLAVPLSGFFSKLGIPLLQGRTFAAADTMGGLQVTILNKPAASRLFPNEDPVGRRVAFERANGSTTLLDVVGVVGDVKVGDFLAPPEPAFYTPYAQQAYPTGSALLVTTRVAPDEAVPLLQRWLRKYEPHLAIINSITYRDVVRGALYQQRMNAELFTALAVMGLILACAGIFSVVSLSVARRTREIGVRKAIGSTAGAINALVVRQTMGPVLVGGVVGLVGAGAGAKLLASLLYGVEASDPVVLVGGIGILLLAALLAAYGPAFRASRVDPVSALRAD